jgi:hypothetical protein
MKSCGYRAAEKPYHGARSVNPARARRYAAPLRVTFDCAPWSPEGVGTGNVLEVFNTPAARRTGNDDLDKWADRHDFNIVGVGSADTKVPSRREVEMKPPTQTAAATAEVDVRASA